MESHVKRLWLVDGDAGDVCPLLYEGATKLASHVAATHDRPPSSGHPTLHRSLPSFVHDLPSAAAAGSVTSAVETGAPAAITQPAHAFAPLSTTSSAFEAAWLQLHVGRVQYVSSFAKSELPPFLHDSDASLRVRWREPTVVTAHTSSPPTSAPAASPLISGPRAVAAFTAQRVPEIAFTDAVGEALVAHGQGVLTEPFTGIVMYAGACLAGYRHGRGKATILARGTQKEVLCGDVVPVLSVVGEYDGEWAYGLRHGHGSLVQVNGDKYEGQWYADKPHGTGVETVIGGGIFRGCWQNGVKHGCGTFTWHVGGRTELRQYEAGSLVATVQVEMPGAPLARQTSGMSLSQLVVQSGARSTSAGLVVAGEHEAKLEGGGAPGLGLSLDAAGAPVGSTTLTVLGTASAGAGSGAASQLPMTTVYTIPMPLPPAQRPNVGVLRFLRHCTVSDIPLGRAAATSGDIIFVSKKDTVEACLTKMTEHSVLSVPVFDPETERYVAVLHMLDVFNFMLELVAKKKATFSPSGAGLRETLAHQRRFATAAVQEVLEMNSHLSPISFRPLPSGAPLIYAAQTLAEGAHSVPIVDPSGKIVRMLTQADIIRFLAAHLDELGAMGTMTLGELGLGASSDSLVIAHFSDKAVDIFAQLRAKQAPAAPVVDNYGAMTANVSFSDLKAIARRANFSSLQLPLHQYFLAIEKGSEVMSPSIYVKANTQLQSLVLTLAATKIHQLYFVDDSLHPTGTVRVVDLLRLLVKEDSGK